MKSSIILLKALLLSTSQRNIYRHSLDKKKKRRIIANTAGLVLLYALVAGYGIAVCIGYGMYGIIDAAPVMCALMISALAFIFTVFKTNGYLFHFKEYDMLMALPIEVKTVAACKFLYMYIKSLPWYLIVSVSTLIGYGYFARPPVIIYPVWIVLSAFLPVIPMLAAAFIGFLIAKISAGFRKTNLIQTILTFIFIIFCFSLRFIVEGLFRDEKVQATLETVSEVTGSAAKVYLPAGWFVDAVAGHRLSGALLLTGVSLLLFEAVFFVVGKSYRNINSALKSHAAAKKYRMTTAKKQSVVRAVAFKEFRRLTGSTVYMTNGAIGEILAVLLGLVTLFVGFDRIISIVTNNAPVNPAMLAPAIPFVVYFFIGMVSTTAMSPSLEGKNYWIVQSMPIEKKKLYQGKMLFNLCLTIPCMLFSVLCLCISAGVPFTGTVLYLILGTALCVFSTTWGCVCGIKHMRLDWENEIEVIKQGSAVAFYMFPNMFAVMGLTVLSVFLGTRMNHDLLTVLMILAAVLLAALCYLRVLALSKR